MDILKVVDKNNRSGTVIITVVRAVPTYKEALEIAERLNRENTKPNVKYQTGGVIYR